MFHVYHSEKAETKQQIFFCQVKKDESEQIVKATHAFLHQYLGEEAKHFNYLGEFVRYATIIEWATASGEKLPIPDTVEEKQVKKPQPVINWGDGDEEQDEDTYE